MITTQHSRVKTTGEQPRSFISYFQSVSTIGIINRARSASEADEKARKKLSNSDFMCGVVGQTPFELYATDEWQPTLVSEEETNLPDGSLEITQVMQGHVKTDPIIVNLNEETKSRIAKKLGHKPTELSNESCMEFIKTILGEELGYFE